LKTSAEKLPKIMALLAKSGRMSFFSFRNRGDKTLADVLKEMEGEIKEHFASEMAAAERRYIE
jgi:16S rRNA C1402 N4-methylase RsmH